MRIGIQKNARQWVSSGIKLGGRPENEKKRKKERGDLPNPGPLHPESPSVKTREATEKSKIIMRTNGIGRKLNRLTRGAGSVNIVPRSDFLELVVYSHLPRWSSSGFYKHQYRC